MQYSAFYIFVNRVNRIERKMLGVSTFIRFLKSWMSSKDINNKGLAVLLGVSPSTVGGWVNDAYRPDGERILKLAEVTGRSPIDIFAMAYELDLEGAGGRRDALDAEMAALLDGLSESELRTVKDVLTVVVRGLRSLDRNAK